MFLQDPHNIRLIEHSISQIPQPPLHYTPHEHQHHITHHLHNKLGTLNKKLKAQHKTHNTQPTSPYISTNTWLQIQEKHEQLKTIYKLSQQLKDTNDPHAHNDISELLQDTLSLRRLHEKTLRFHIKQDKLQYLINISNTTITHFRTHQYREFYQTLNKLITRTGRKQSSRCSRPPSFSSRAPPTSTWARRLRPLAWC